MYARNSSGTAFSEDVQVSTNSTIATVAVDSSNIHIEEAYIKIKIVNDGGVAIFTKGVCWSATPNPTRENTHLEQAGNGDGEFTIGLLTPSTEYFLRAYAVNENGVSYSNPMHFTTQPESYYLNGVWDLISIQNKFLDFNLGRSESGSTEEMSTQFQQGILTYTYGKYNFRYDYGEERVLFDTLKYLNSRYDYHLEIKILNDSLIATSHKKELSSGVISSTTSKAEIIKGSNPYLGGCSTENWQYRLPFEGGGSYIEEDNGSFIEGDLFVDSSLKSDTLILKFICNEPDYAVYQKKYLFVR